MSTHPALVLDEDAFVRQLLDGLGAYPAYYAHMAPLNLAGPESPDLTPAEPAQPHELRRRLEAGEWVVDLRTRSVFAGAHLPGSVNIGLDGSFATWVGWLVPSDAPLTLLAATRSELADAQRELVRIGVERPAAAATGAPRAWASGAQVRGYPVADFTDLAERLRHGQLPYVLDVRLPEEHNAGRVVGSTNIPLPELAARLDEVPDDREIWVHCGMGYRAAIAASLLRRDGFVVVLVDDEFGDAADAGVPLAA